MPKNKTQTQPRMSTKEASKTKVAPAPKRIDDDEDEEKMIDPDGILGDDASEDEEELGLDDDEVDPFGDKWEQ